VHYSVHKIPSWGPVLSPFSAVHTHLPLRCILILFSHLILGFLSGLSNKLVYAFVTFYILAKCPDQHTLLELITPIRAFGEEKTAFQSFGQSVS
jgi:hypothetical protein